MTSQWNKTWYTGHPECSNMSGQWNSTGDGKPCCSSCATGGPCEGMYTSSSSTKPCCSSCATGGPCEGVLSQPRAGACCDSCARGGPCQGGSTVNRREYWQPPYEAEGPFSDTQESYYWPRYRNVRKHRAGLPSHRDLPDLLDGKKDEPFPGESGENTLAPSRYRRMYHLEKEPYFFAKEYEIPFCQQHPTPWSEDGYYYYKRAHNDSKDQGQ